MNELRKFVILLFGIFVSMGVNILVLIKGWGLEPKSWSFILLVTFFGQMFALTIIELGRDKSET